MGVATTAVGWMVGLWVYNTYIGGGTMVMPTDSAPSAEDIPSSFNYSGYDN